MNKKRKAVLKKYRKSKRRRKNDHNNPLPVKTWVYAVGRIREDDLSYLKRDLRSSELGKLSTIATEKIDPGYLRIQLKTKMTAAFLLEHSLAQGILRSWGDRLKINSILAL